MFYSWRGWRNAICIQMWSENWKFKLRKRKIVDSNAVNIVEVSFTLYINTSCWINFKAFLRISRLKINSCLWLGIFKASCTNYFVWGKHLFIHFHLGFFHISTLSHNKRSPSSRFTWNSNRIDVQKYFLMKTIARKAEFVSPLVKPYINELRKEVADGNSIEVIA